MLLRSNFKLAAWKVCQVCVWEVMRSQSFVSSSNLFPTDLKRKLQRFKTCKWVQTLKYLTSWSIKDFRSSLSTIYLLELIFDVIVTLFRMSFYTNRPISGKYEISFMPKTQTSFQSIRKVWGFEENRQTEDRCQIVTVKVEKCLWSHDAF